MSGSILVAYATKYGSSAEVAEKVAARLRDRGLDVRVEGIRDVGSLEGVGSVVLGAPLYVGSLLRDATAFLKRNQDALQRMPVAVFALGPLTAEEEADDSGKQLDAALAKSALWLSPVAKATFVGKYDPEQLRGADKLIAKLKASPLYGVPMRDDRDWAAIEEWADGLAAILA